MEKCYACFTTLYLTLHDSVPMMSRPWLPLENRLFWPQVSSIVNCYSKSTCRIDCVAVLNCIRVLGGYTRAESAETVFDTDNFIETKYVEYIHSTSGNISLALNWYVFSMRDRRSAFIQCCFLSIGTILSRYCYFNRGNYCQAEYAKVVSYYSVGYIQEAAELGFGVYQSRGSHPKFVLYVDNYIFADSNTVIGMYAMHFFFTVLPYLHVSAPAPYHATNKSDTLLKSKQMIST